MEPEGLLPKWFAYGLENKGWISGGGRDFCPSLQIQPPIEPTRPPKQKVRQHYPWGKQQQSESDQLLGFDSLQGDGCLFDTTPHRSCASPSLLVSVYRWLFTSL
jgi:hypothetical protein